MPPSIVLFSVDTLRFDCVGYQPDRRYLDRYGLGDAVRTPNLDRLAAGAACFTQAVSVASYTTPAHASLLTGLYPPSSGVRAFYKTRLIPGTPTLATLLRAAGYTTLAITDTPELFKPLGLFAGFQATFGPGEDDRFLQALGEAARTGPTLAFVHVFDVHDPYLLPEGPLGPGDADDFLEMVDEIAELYQLRGLNRQAEPHRLFRDLVQQLPGGKKPAALFLPYYLRGVEKFDRGRLARFLDAFDKLGLLRDGVLALLADHGEGEAEGQFEHWGPLIEEVVRVPLLLYAPGRAQPGRLDQQVSLADVAPTLLDLAGLVDHGCFEGRSLGPLLRRERSEGDSLGYAEWWAADTVADDAGRADGAAPEGASWLNEIVLPMPARRWYPKERMLRTPTCKVVVRGQLEGLLAANRPDLSNSEFVQQLFVALWGHRPSPAQLARETKLLERGALSRQQLADFHCGAEAVARQPRVARYDLLDDPFEERPIVTARSAREALELGAAVALIADRSARARPAPPIFGPAKAETAVPVPAGSEAADQAGGSDEYTPQEQEAVAQRLADLGYI